MLLEKMDMECEKMDLNANFYEIGPHTTWLISPLDFCPEFTNGRVRSDNLMVTKRDGLTNCTRPVRSILFFWFDRRCREWPFDRLRVTKGLMGREKKKIPREGGRKDYEGR